MGIYDRAWYREDKNNNDYGFNDNIKISKEDAKKLKELIEGGAKISSSNSKNEPPKVDSKYKTEFISNQEKHENEIENKVDEIIRNIDNKNKIFNEKRKQNNIENDYNYNLPEDKNHFNPAFFILFVPITAFLIFLGVSLFNGVKTFIYKRENSQRLLIYRYQESTKDFFSYKIIDPSLNMSSEIKNEIMRIKKEVNSQLKYGKTARLSVEWLNKFDAKNQKPVADCDDFAYLFWKISQDSKILKDKIFFATTDDEIFAHAFNLIWIGGEWRAIEPQNLDIVLDLSYSTYVGTTKDAFNKWLEKHQVIIYDVGNMNYARAAVPLFK